MPKVVAVHGIAQQGKGPNLIHKDWYEAVLDGLRYSGTPLASGDLACPCYSDLFRRRYMNLGAEETSEATARSRFLMKPIRSAAKTPAIARTVKSIVVFGCSLAS